MRSRDEIRVGVSLSLSGEFQLQGQDALRGVRLWFDYVARDGGIALGHSRSRRSPRLIVYDDGSKTERAKDNVLRLLTKDGLVIQGVSFSQNVQKALGKILQRMSTDPSTRSSSCSASKESSGWMCRRSGSIGVDRG
jgi:ABC-type branched-subunit amino acid transport system substrate-binding protein